MGLADAIAAIMAILAQAAGQAATVLQTVIDLLTTLMG